MQGGGFAGTIQAFVPGMLTAKYHDAIEKVLSVRATAICSVCGSRGLCGSFEHLDPAKQKELHTPAEAGIVKLFHVTGKTTRIAPAAVSGAGLHP